MQQQQLLVLQLGSRLAPCLVGLSSVALCLLLLIHHVNGHNNTAHRRSGTRVAPAQSQPGQAPHSAQGWQGGLGRRQGVWGAAKTWGALGREDLNTDLHALYETMLLLCQAKLAN